MKIIFELSPSEMVSAAHNGTLQLFIENARKDENTMAQVKEMKDQEAAAKAEIAAAAPAQTDFSAPAAFNPTVTAPTAAPAAFNPTVTAPATAAPAAFNPTVTAPATAAPAAFNPMAFAPVTPAATNAPAPVTQTAPPVTPGAPQATIDEVRAKIAPLIKAGKVAEMQALFAEFGAQKLTYVNPAHYAALIARAATI